MKRENTQQYFVNASLTFVKKSHIRGEYWSFYFEQPAGFLFHAGQYIQLTLPTHHADARGISRFFSIASSPTEEKIMITTRIAKKEQEQSTFKKSLFGLAEGVSVAFVGPMGTFVLAQESITS